MIVPEANGVYAIELCSGERHYWRYLGTAENAPVWWRDLETGREFNEGSLMYAWQIVEQIDDRSAVK